MKSMAVMSVLAFCAVTPAAIAHHSRAAVYDLGSMVEVEGEGYPDSLAESAHTILARIGSRRSNSSLPNRNDTAWYASAARH